MHYPESPRKPRGLVTVTKPERKPRRVDELDLWLSTGRKIDGLWVGTTESKPHPALQRIEQALQLIKRHDAFSYSRVTNHLDRIWVHLLPGSGAAYETSLNACMIDERYVLGEQMTLERIASTIVHEATHARLDAWGIAYDEEKRTRIEAICLRRELYFRARLPDSDALREEVVRTLEWAATSRDYYSDASFQRRDDRGNVDTLRYLGAPRWLISLVLRMMRRRRQRARLRATS